MSKCRPGNRLCRDGRVLGMASTLRDGALELGFEDLVEVACTGAVRVSNRGGGCLVLPLRGD